MSWLSETLPKRRSPASFAPVRLHCPQRVSGVACGEILIHRTQWPVTWQVYPVAIARPDMASGRGPICKCPRCAQLSEIVIHAPSAAA